MEKAFLTIDGNEAAARVAYATNEVIAIYPITPASAMGELCDSWSAGHLPNLYGDVPDVVEMEHEGGAAGAVHGALQAGALSTTFTASQGLLLMIPNMFKIAGELTPMVMHVAARTIATHALSIFGDHSDVMAARSTGWAMLCSSNVQEAQDFALIAQAATLESRIPFLHFFDGFRTSHEVQKIVAVDAAEMRAMIADDWIHACRARALSPEHPVLRGSAQNPDVFFQAREAVNPFYLAAVGIVEQAMQRFAQITGRSYRPFEYYGAPDAQRVIVLMGSGIGAVQETVDALNGQGEHVGVLGVRLYRPFSPELLVAALPASTVQIAVLDRTKEPGSVGDPLFLDVVAALHEQWRAQHPNRHVPNVVGGRYGLASKEFTPAMAAAVFAELASPEPKRRFTLGIVDDVTRLSLSAVANFVTEAKDGLQAVFYGLGSDGTVGANKNTVKIVGESTPFFAQGYFVYDSKKSGSTTCSHLRFSRQPIRSTYLIQSADFVACHQFQFLEQMDVLAVARPGATLLLNSPYGADKTWDMIPRETQQTIIDKKIRVFVVDGARIAADAGLAGRINTVLQTCFFQLTNLMPLTDALGKIKTAIAKTYAKAGKTIIERNNAAVDAALEGLHELSIPSQAKGTYHRRQFNFGADASPFVQRVTAAMLAGYGDHLPVSAMPVDGTFPTGTSKYEKRNIAAEIPIWDPDVCIECGLCTLVCPHAAIRAKTLSPEAASAAPAGFAMKPWTGKELAGRELAIQVAPDDCTGCGVCVDVCPARRKDESRRKAIHMEPKIEHVERERRNFDYFLKVAETDRQCTDHHSVKGLQLLEPLFEYSGACSGCGETPYLKLMSQLFGDRVLVANATGCSSIFGGNLPTTPWTVNAEGHGPAWCNSLFEDNAEFGLGMRLAVDQQRLRAQSLLRQLAEPIGPDLVAAILENPQRDETSVAEQRRRVAELKKRLGRIIDERSADLLAVADTLIRRDVWIVGGDGWAYDIGFGGLDHVLASGRNVNILVLDTEVYSNTGGQASKATPRGAVAKFAASGKQARKKDLAMVAMSYGNVFVAQIALGANPRQALKAFQEAADFDGPSLIIAYSPCIAHGIDMSHGMSHQEEAVKSGYWSIFRYDPRHAHRGDHPLQLDSRSPTMPLVDFLAKEGRFATLARSNPDAAERLQHMIQADVLERRRYYEQLAGVERTVPELEESLVAEVPKP